MNRMAPRTLILLATLGVAGAACGEVVEPEGFAPATSTTILASESGASSVEGGVYHRIAAKGQAQFSRIKRG